MTDVAIPTIMAAPKHWALLIGIDFYVGQKCLKGCVRDVNTVKQYLEAGKRPADIDITILTASPPSDPSSRRPAEHPNSWPTSQNVTEKLLRVIDKSNPGDFVYIHYSGHGTRETISGKYAQFGHHSGNLAFVLFENNNYGMRYFQGQLLASCLRKMVDKGLLVTVVLDCCYSGSVLRGVCGAGIRGIDYNPDIDTASLPEPLTSSFDLGHSLRDSRMSPDQWFVNPDGYAILSACGPHEVARELKLDAGERRGALSYFLMEALSTLTKSGVEATHESLYQHLLVRFHAAWPQQTPMRYGNKNFTFFGPLTAAPATEFISIGRTEPDGRLYLDAGRAHGVHEGDEFAAFPFDKSEAGAADLLVEAALVVRAEAVWDVTSDLVGVGPALAIHQIQTGWRAKPMTSLSPRKVPVRIMKSARGRIQWDKTAPRQRFLRLCTEDDDEDEDAEACVFNVTVNGRGEYEILDGSMGAISSLPTIPLGEPGADSGVMDVLQHIATFKYFEGVENRTLSASSKGSFSLEPTSEPVSGVFHVRDGDIWGFTVKNHDKTRPLYLAIFNSTPSWGIANLVPSGFLVVQPDRGGNSGVEEIKLEMKLPEFLRRRGEKECKDVIKVFATKTRTNFPSMILPDVPFLGQRHHQRAGGVDDALSAFLAELAAPSRKHDYHLDKGWATETFIIRTTVAEN